MRDLRGWDIDRLEKLKQRILQTIEGLSSRTDGSLDEKFAIADEIDTLKDGVYEIEKEIAIKEKIERGLAKK